MIWLWVKKWALVAIGVPVLAWVLDRVADTVEERKGQTAATKGLHGVADKARRWRSGRKGGKKRSRSGR